MTIIDDLDIIDGAASERAKTPVYRAKRGHHWHFEAPAGTAGVGYGYLFTACEGRLGRWTLVPTRTRGEVDTATMCPDCLRKSNEHVIKIETGARP